MEAIEQVAAALGDDLDQVVFVGVQWPLSTSIRSTFDPPRTSTASFSLRRADYYDLTHRLGHADSHTS